MKAEWSDETDPKICLCCGQTVLAQRDGCITPENAAAKLDLFEALGYTRDSLLTKHRAQLDYQAPGFAEWLEGQ